MKNKMKKILAGILCLSMILGSSGMVYAEEAQNQEVAAQEAETSEETEMVEDEVAEQTTQETDEIEVGRVSDQIVTMDGERENPDLYGMDENGNVYQMTEDEIAAFPVEDTESKGRASSVKIVNFRATQNGDTVSTSSTTEYTEYETGLSGYICGAYGADAAYLGTVNGKVKFMISGVVGLVDEAKVQVVSLDTAQSYSCYYADTEKLIHRICMNMTTPGYGGSSMVGLRPDYLTAGNTYYSYDGHYFYTNYATMIADYQADSRSRSVNPNQPYYNYYQYLPARSSSNYSGTELSTLINGFARSGSKMYDSGSSFVDKQNTYGANAMLMIGVAANESAWGSSYYAMNRNNLFGINAIDSDPDQATMFASADACIKDYAETYLSKRYLRAGYTYYHGAFLGDKSSGMNVSWASDPYWGEKAANVAWNLDKNGGYKDKNKYTIGIKDTKSTSHSNVNVRKEATTSSAVLYTTGSHSNYAVLIRGEKNGFYEIQSDAVLNSGRTAVNKDSGVYDTNKMYAYISKDYVQVITTGNGSSGNDQPSNDTEGIDYSVHAQKYGWMETVSDGEMAGTSGESKRLEAIKISLRNPSVSGSVRYRVHCQKYGWMDWVSDGAMSGTSGESKRLEAIQIELTGEMAEKYDIYYRVHSQTYGWLGWAKNGAKAGTSGESKRLESIEIKLVKKGGSAPGSTENSYIQSLIQYKTHVQKYGWQDWKKDGELSGTSGESKRLEGIQIKLISPEASGSVEYRTHVQKYGWQDWKKDGETSGTSGESKRLEAIQIRLTDEMAELYDIYYRVHCQTYGWLDWAKNGEYAGTSGLSKRLESIEIQMVPKGAEAPGETSQPYLQSSVQYQTYVKDIGWQDTVIGGGMSGTIGTKKTIQAVKIQLNKKPYAGTIEYKLKIADEGWGDYVNSGTVAGIEGSAKQAEAIRIQLTGKMEENYDVYYRAHCQNYGWLGWAKNGQPAGSSDLNKRLEAIQVILVEKGDEAPGSTTDCYRT